MKRRALGLLFVALLGLVFWFGWHRRHPQPAPVDLTQHDGQTIDFSSGKPVVKNSPTDQAALDQAAKELAAATDGVTFEAPKKQPGPKKSEAKKN